MRQLLIWLLLFLTGCATATAPATVADPAAADIERFVQQALREVPEAPSLGVAVVRDGKTLYLHDAQTGYYIGSTTKAYTGLACAILAQRGQLDLDAPITKYLPEVQMVAPLDASKLTLRKFLSHTSGIDNDPIVVRTAFTGEHTPSSLIALLNSSKPGKDGFRYDNLGYVVASLVLERVTGKPWQKVLDELVYTPLGMDHTSSSMSEAMQWPMAEPHQINRKGEIAVTSFRKRDETMHAAGGIVTTPADLARWLSANLTHGGGGIPAAAFEEAQKTQAAAAITRGDFKSRGYGFGWYQSEYKGENALFHGGGYEGWQSWYTFLPERGIAVGVMTNASGPPAMQAVLAVASYAIDRLSGKADVDTAYGQRIAKLKDDTAKGRAMMIADVEKRSKRPWMLQHANNAYAGRYESPTLGELRIEKDSDRLVASLGRLRAPLEAFTEPESARVELVPNSGEVLRFKFNGDRVASVTWGDNEFRRVD